MNAEIKQVTKAREIPDASNLKFILISVVSGEHQEKGSSLNDQEKRMKNALNILGAKFYPQFLFKKQQHRTEGWKRWDYQFIKHCIEEGKDGLKANAVMIDRYDRWSRDDVAGQIMRRYLRDNGIEFYQLNNRDDLLSPTSNFTAGIQGKMSQNYTDQLKVNLAGGKMKAFKQGKPMSTLPFLWDYIIKKDQSIEYLVIPERVPIFQTAIKLYQSKKYSSYIAVADEMNKRGIKWYDRRKKYEHNIDKSLIKNFINRKVFHTGIWEDRKEFSNNFTGESYKGTLKLPMEHKGKPISSLAIYNQLQAVKKSNSRFNGTKINEWLLSGFVRCCGEPVVISITTREKQKYYYYKCNKCGFAIPKEPFEASVVSSHDALFKNPDEIKKAIEGHPDKVKFAKQELADCQKSSTTIKKQMTNIEQSFKDKLTSKLRTKLNKEYEELDTALGDKEKEIKVLESEIATLSKTDEMEELISLARTFRNVGGLEGTSFAFKRKFLLNIYPRINKNYCVTVEKEGKSFSWIGKGIVSNHSGEFLRGKIDSEKIDTVELVGKELGRKPSAAEMKKLKDSGLWGNLFYNFGADKSRFM